MSFTSYLIAFVLCALFCGLCYLVERAFMLAFDWIWDGITRLFSGKKTRRAAGLGVRQREALEEEVVAYMRDWRLLIVACVAKLAKIDGVVSKKELTVVEEVFESLELTGAQRPLAIDTFRSAKKGPTMFQTCVQLYYERYRREVDLLELLVGMLFAIAHADGDPNPQTRQALLDVCHLMGLDYQWCADASKGRKAKTKPTHIEAAYKVLGCQPTDALTVIKDRYRKLVKDFHPDTIMSKGLPAEFIQFAEERFKQIQAAYETVMESRTTSGGSTVR